MRTCLYDNHVRAGGKIVDFHGWEMPVQYAGIVDEHRRVRTAAGLFDISHMGRLAVRGPDALPFLQAVLPCDVAAIPAGRIRYTLLLNERGGIIDDLLVYRHPDHFGLIVNAGNREKAVAWLEGRRNGRQATLTDRTLETGMVAVQGPAALGLAAALVGEPLNGIRYYGFIERTLAFGPVLISRTGYTGEDGVELVVPAVAAAAVWNRLLELGRDAGLAPAGLGARDTLRLEAGMPLHGHEIDENVTPLEAGLDRFVLLDKPEFVGREALLAQREGGVPRALCGLRVTSGKKIPRAECPVLADGRAVGRVTSGTFSPTLQVPLAMALVARDRSAPGAPLTIDVRGTPVPASVVPLPFYRRAKP